MLRKYRRVLPPRTIPLAKRITQLEKELGEKDQLLSKRVSELENERTLRGIIYLIACCAFGFKIFFVPKPM